MKKQHNGMTCSNCGEPITSWDPLVGAYCGACLKERERLTLEVRKIFALFGETRRREREVREREEA
jgi:predicted amidophosphoribosyltransferase